MNKLRYQKPQAVKKLERLALEHFRREHPNFPEYAIAPQSYRDDTANGLTRCVVDFIRYNGGQAERINTTGMPRTAGRADHMAQIQHHERQRRHIGYDWRPFGQG